MSSGGSGGYGAPAAPQGYLGGYGGPNNYIAPQMTGNYTNDLAAFRAAGSPDSNSAWVAPLAAEQQAWMAANPGQGNNPTTAAGANPFMGNQMPRYGFGGFGFYPGGSQNQGPGQQVNSSMGMNTPRQYVAGYPGSGTGGGSNNSYQVTSDPGQLSSTTPGLLGQSSAPVPGTYAAQAPAGQTPTLSTSGAPYQGQTFTGQNGQAGIPSFMQDPRYGKFISPAQLKAGQGGQTQAWLQQTLPDRQAYFQSLTNDRDKADFLAKNGDLRNATAAQMGSNWAPWLNKATFSPYGQ